MRKFYTLFLLLGFTAVQAQTIAFDGAGFKNELLGIPSGDTCALDINGDPMVVDTNADGEIQVSEALNVYHIEIHFWINIDNLIGIEYFTNVKTITCTNTPMTVLDLSMLPNLEDAWVYNNQLSQLYFGPANIKLKRVDCSDNQLVQLELAGTQLWGLRCSNNQLSDLLVHFDPSVISPDPNMNYLECSGNALTNLEVSGKVSDFFVYNNQLAHLDLSHLQADYVLINDNQPLVWINLKNGFADEQYFSFGANDLATLPNLQYLCVDDFEVADFLAEPTIQSLSINTYCSFNPGGTFYDIVGHGAYDTDVNGCDASDAAIPFLKMQISDGTQTGNFLADDLGGFTFPVQEGTHTVTPVLENPAYFVVSPSSATVSFPADPNPIEQSFCIAPNGSHLDLEVYVYPLGAARPGFPADYKLVYKNKGTVPHDGIITFNFPSTAHFVSASAAPVSQYPNVINWAFADLQPLASGAITFTMQVNTPTDALPVNAGDVLHYLAAMTVVEAEETPDDNQQFFNQTVVNSFDPNDKTCLEGDFITIDRVGTDVHYMIRFENNGTANAQNIVITDDIDTQRFTLSSLIPLAASHNFRTRIDGNRVEFIFEDINLPFDDASNDGFILFKIKTGTTLEVGDAFSNTAAIYFDYNHPIITNTATTLVSALLQASPFDDKNEFSVYPNPVADVLHIGLSGRTDIESIDIYNNTGQIVSTHVGPTDTIDTRRLAPGLYFVRIMAQSKGTVLKFIKR